MSRRIISSGIVYEEMLENGFKYTETNTGHVNINFADASSDACMSMTFSVETAKTLGAILAKRFGEAPKKDEKANV